MKFGEFQGIKGTIYIDSGKAGHRAVIFSGVHGDELSGVKAVENLLSEFESGKYTLLQGSLVLVHANEEAIKLGKRYIQYNLNRQFKDSYEFNIDINTYEYQRAQELKPILQNCDYFLDLHSAPIAQEPFLICESGPVEFFKNLGLKKVITGWGKFSNGPIGGDTENYANLHGAQSATLEAGSHFDPESIKVAFKTCVSMLSCLNMIDGQNRPNEISTEIFDMYHVQTKESADFEYVSDVKNFLPISKGNAYAYQNQEPLIVSEDSYLLVPMKPEDTKVGEEICYLGRKVA